MTTFDDLQPIVAPERLIANGKIVIAGPCAAESQEQVLDTAMALAAGGIKIFRAGVWKPRTHPGGFEGCGDEALGWLSRVRRTTGMLTATEVATAAHTRAAVEAGVDLLWIGARTTSNPFAVQEIADTLASMGATGRAVLVKNPISPDIELWIGALMRLYGAGVRRLGAVHRGFHDFMAESSPYRNPPLWHVPIELRRRYPRLPLICDPSHIGGRRDLIGEISQQALDTGFDGLIIESHCDPCAALSDARQQLTPEALLATLGTLNYRHTQLPHADALADLRGSIDAIDSELVALLARRMEVSRRIGDYKRCFSVPVLQPERFDALMAQRKAEAEREGMSGDFMQQIMQAIHAESVRQQLGGGSETGKK